MFLGYEEVSRAYHVYDINARQVVISRNVNFDESVLGTGPAFTYEDVEDLDLESLDLADDDLRPMHFQQAGKRKIRSHDEDNADSRPRVVLPRPGLGEASAPGNHFLPRSDDDEETQSCSLHDVPTSPCFGMQVQIRRKLLLICWKQQ